MQDSLQYFHKPIHVIQGGIRPHHLMHRCEEDAETLRKRLHIPDGAPILGILARLSEVKGQLDAVKALPRILETHPGAVLVFAYPRASSYRKKIESLVKQLGVKSCVRWFGKLDNVLGD